MENVRAVGKSGGSCTFPSYKGDTKFLNLLGAFYLNCLMDVKFYSFAGFVHLPRVGQVVNSLCPSTYGGGLFIPRSSQLS